MKYKCLKIEEQNTFFGQYTKHAKVSGFNIKNYLKILKHHYLHSYS